MLGSNAAKVPLGCGEVGEGETPGMTCVAGRLVVEDSGDKFQARF